MSVGVFVVFLPVSGTTITFLSMTFESQVLLDHLLDSNVFVVPSPAGMTLAEEQQKYQQTVWKIFIIYGNIRSTVFCIKTSVVFEGLGITNTLDFFECRI